MTDVKGKIVLILASHVNTGESVAFATKAFYDAGASSVRVFAMVKTEGPLAFMVKPAMTLFEVEGGKPVGFGIGIDGFGRNSTSLSVVREKP